MRAVGLDYDSKTLQEKDVPEPDRELGPEEVRFRVREVGICGTDRDLALFRFGNPPAGESFLIVGHEAIGQVEATGSRCHGIGAGDWVAPLVRRPCSPACVSCARGRRDYCLTGRYTERGIFGQHGYFTEVAVDQADDLVRIPPERASVGVLFEPLTVVEKAVHRALAAHPWEPRRALVLGAGTIGILAALVLSRRGLEVTVHSLESGESPRARLLERAGLRYATKLESKADIVMEAAGSAGAVMHGLAAMEQMGVLVVLGARQASVDFPFLQMIVANQTIIGSVNTDPESARRAASDLAAFDLAVLDSLIERVSFNAFRTTILGSAPERPKLVHVIE